MTLHDRADIEHRLCICRHDVERLHDSYSLYCERHRDAIHDPTQGPDVVADYRHKKERARQSLQSAELRCAAVANELTQMGETV